MSSTNGGHEPHGYELGTALDGQSAKHINEFLRNELKDFENMHGTTGIAEHHIVMRDERPIKQRYYPKNPAMQKILHEKVDELLRQGCIEPSSSPYSAPVVLVKKKNGTWRLCVDYRQLNARSLPDAYPLPRIHHILDRLRNAKFITSLDLKDGYWQIPMAKDSQKYTAFTVPGRGLFQWRVMPFGLHSAPATFQRALDSVIGPDLEPAAFAYLDDIIITSGSLDEHVKTLTEVFRRLKVANLEININKCEFFRQEVKYLGHHISAAGIHTDPEKISAIQALKAPTNVRELRRCLGIASWYRRFVPAFADTARPMTELLKKDRKFKWEEPQQKAFEELKRRLTEAPVLACPDFSKTFRLQTDASDYGLGAVLTQQNDGEEKVIAYASRHLDKAELNYSTTEKECLAVVWGIRKMREYLEGYQFIVVTDHMALKWLNSIESPSGRVARWALELQQFQFTIEYRKGKQNVIADALSRQPQTTLQRIKKGLDQRSWLQSKIDDVREHPEDFPEYTIENNQLYRFFSRGNSGEDISPWKLCVPQDQRERVLRENHDEPTAGHQGVRKTIARVANRYFWPGMFKDVKRYVLRCQECQRFKASQQAQSGRMLTHIPEEPWSTVCVDFVGPLPRSKKGNTTLLVLQDKFTKWVELIPMRKATADGVVKGFRERILARFGAPKRLISDNGTQFTSSTLKRALAKWGIHHQLTAPYTPQENAVERANRVVKTMVAQYAENNQRTWDEWLPELSLAINTGVSESTGFSPAYLVQGREPRLPEAYYDAVTPGTGTPEEPADEKATRMREIRELVSRNLQQASQSQAHYYNLRRRDWKPKVGQLVLLKEHPLSKAIDGFAAKLAPKYGGPYKVEQFISPAIIRVKAVQGGRTRIAHLRDVKEFHARDGDTRTKTIERRSLRAQARERSGQQ